MIDGNTFKFGYGDILVNHNFNTLILYEIDTPQKIGKMPDDTSYTILHESHILFYSVQDIDKVIEHLKDILLDKAYYQFEYNSSIFDFTNWNKTSIQICIDAMMEIRRWFMIPLAA